MSHVNPIIKKGQYDRLTDGHMNEPAINTCHTCLCILPTRTCVRHSTCSHTPYLSTHKPAWYSPTLIRPSWPRIELTRISPCSVRHRQRTMKPQNQNILPVTRQNDNHSPRPGPGRLVPSSHRRSELQTPSSAPSAEEITESGSAFQSLMAWGKATLINISISNGDQICQRMVIPAAPIQGW